MTVLIGWRWVPGFEGRYEVNQAGTVLSHVRKVPRPLKPTPAKRGGYLTVNLKGKVYKVHRLVAEAFIPNPHGLPLVRHRDGNGLNNVVWNLAWGTHLENADDARRRGTTPRGVGHWSAKLTDDDVRRIRELAARGVTARDMARSGEFGVVEQTISRIASGRGWKHVK